MTSGKEHREIYSASVALWTGYSDVSNLSPAKVGFSLFSVFISHPNSGLETISIFYLTILNSLAKKLLLGTKNNGGVFGPLANPS